MAGHTHTPQSPRVSSHAPRCPRRSPWLPSVLIVLRCPLNDIRSRTLSRAAAGRRDARRRPPGPTRDGASGVRQYIYPHNKKRRTDSRRLRARRGRGTAERRAAAARAPAPLAGRSRRTGGGGAGQPSERGQRPAELAPHDSMVYSHLSLRSSTPGGTSGRRRAGTARAARREDGSRGTRLSCVPRAMFGFRGPSTPGRNRAGCRGRRKRGAPRSCAAPRLVRARARASSAPRRSRAQ